MKIRDFLLKAESPGTVRTQADHLEFTGEFRGDSYPRAKYPVNDGSDPPANQQRGLWGLGQTITHATTGDRSDNITQEAQHWNFQGSYPPVNLLGEESWEGQAEGELEVYAYYGTAYYQYKSFYSFCSPNPSVYFLENIVRGTVSRVEWSGAALIAFWHPVFDSADCSTASTPIDQGYFYTYDANGNTLSTNNPSIPTLLISGDWEHASIAENTIGNGLIYDPDTYDFVPAASQVINGDHRWHDDFNGTPINDEGTIKVEMEIYNNVFLDGGIYRMQVSAPIPVEGTNNDIGSHYYSQDVALDRESSLTLVKHSEINFTTIVESLVLCYDVDFPCFTGAAIEKEFCYPSGTWSQAVFKYGASGFPAWDTVVTATVLRYNRLNNVVTVFYDPNDAIKPGDLISVGGSSVDDIGTDGFIAANIVENGRLIYQKAGDDVEETTVGNGYTVAKVEDPQNVQGLGGATYYTCSNSGNILVRGASCCGAGPYPGDPGNGYGVVTDTNTIGPLYLGDLEQYELKTVIPCNYDSGGYRDCDIYFYLSSTINGCLGPGRIYVPGYLCGDDVNPYYPYPTRNPYDCNGQVDIDGHSRWTDLDQLTHTFATPIPLKEGFVLIGMETPRVNSGIGYSNSLTLRDSIFCDRDAYASLFNYAIGGVNDIGALISGNVYYWGYGAYGFFCDTPERECLMTYLKDAPDFSRFKVIFTVLNQKNGSTYEMPMGELTPIGDGSFPGNAGTYYNGEVWYSGFSYTGYIQQMHGDGSQIRGLIANSDRLVITEARFEGREISSNIGLFCLNSGSGFSSTQSKCNICKDPYYHCDGYRDYARVALVGQFRFNMKFYENAGP